jgi:CBS domain-containing protein
MQGFDAQNPPFDRLNRSETDALSAAMDIGYFAPGAAIVTEGQGSDFLHVIIKGAVEERVGDQAEALLGPKDTFDSGAVVHGSAAANFVATEETLCFLLPRETILELVKKNQGFAAFFYSDLSRRLDAFAEQRNPQGFESVLRARVRDARRGDPVTIDGSATIEQAGHAMTQHGGCTAVFVKDGDRIGVVTFVAMSKEVILHRLPLETPVREVANFDVAEVDADDFIFDALLEMTRSKKRRLAVRENGVYAGLLEDIDLLELFAGNSQLIPGRIDRARSVTDLAVAAKDIQGQVERLHEQGVKIEVIAEMTSGLNRDLLARLFDLVAPTSIRKHGCLLIMGSEGRGEQTVRTDQDNGLLLAQEVPQADLDSFRKAFTAALESFGFPPCPGNVMVRNPVWSQPVDSFIKQLKSWILSPGGDSAMNLGIFSDAIAVAGKRDLLVHAKSAFTDMMRGESAHLAHFAQFIDLFASADMGVLGSFMVSVGMRSGDVDVKKVGTFPIVHGVRTMAIEMGVRDTSTALRIRALAASNVLEAPFAQELVSALRLFMEFRLRSQMKARRTGNLSRESIVNMNELSSADRDIFRNAIRVVREFRELVRHRYNLGYF